jgi:mono/diheme cytochrome c family protein
MNRPSISEPPVPGIFIQPLSASFIHSFHVSESLMKVRIVSRFVSLGIIVGVGCGGNSDQPATPVSDPNAMSAMKGPPSGNAVFDSKCANCHAVLAPSGEAGLKKKGPNLSKIGGEHDTEWIASYVKDPKSKKPNSKMPEFGSKLSADEVKSVSDFLAGKK